MRVLTMGTFDLVHPGHVGLFGICRKLAGDGEVHVAINTDPFILKYKGSLPVLNYRERELLTAGCRHVDHVHPNDGKDQAGIITTIAPDLLVIGDDWAQKDYYGQLGITQQFLDHRNITLCYVPRTGNWSTTELKTRLRN